MAEEMDKKAAKKAEKARKKAEKKTAKNMETDLENTEEEEGSSSKLAVALVTLVIIIVWLAILALLIKWDVGGFGSTVMRPLLKDIPYVNRILPDSEDDLSTEEDYPYKNMDEAVAYIKELEQEKAETDEKIDEMKLHKLLYFVQRESYALLGKPMFNEDFEGWIHGPVSKEVRSCYDKDHGMVCNTHSLSEDDAYIARNVIEEYDHYDSWYLRNLSHEEISWKNSRTGLGPEQPGNRIIDKKDIEVDSRKVRPFDSTWGMFYDEFEDEY